MRRALTPLCLSVFALVTPTAAGAEDAAAPPPSIQALAACRPLDDAVEKAACYDAAFDALQAEVESGATVALSRVEIEEARRESVGLPSFSLPGVGHVTRDPAEEEAPTTVRVVELSKSLRGKLSLVTDTGQRWVQVDNEEIRRLPEAPFEIELRPAFAGTYFVTLGGKSGIRLRREE